MGKNLKCKEIGKENSQRKDSLSVVKFENRYGKRCKKSFPTPPLARNRLEEAQYAAQGAAKTTGTRQYQNNYG